MRRGPADPLVWYDGRRWRRRLAVDGAEFLAEVFPAPYSETRASFSPRNGAGLAVRLLVGTVPRPALKRLVARLFGLDDPAGGLSRRLRGNLRRVLAGPGNTAALPG